MTNQKRDCVNNHGITPIFCVRCQEEALSLAEKEPFSKLRQSQIDTLHKENIELREQIQSLKDEKKKMIKEMNSCLWEDHHTERFKEQLKEKIK